MQACEVAESRESGWTDQNRQSSEREGPTGISHTHTQQDIELS